MLACCLRVLACHLWLLTRHLGVLACHLRVLARHLWMLTRHLWMLTCHLGVLARHLGVLARHLGVLTRHLRVLACHLRVLACHLRVSSHCTVGHALCMGIEGLGAWRYVSIVWVSGRDESLFHHLFYFRLSLLLVLLELLLAEGITHLVHGVPAGITGRASVILTLS